MMKYEFHAQFPLALQDSVTQSAAIDFLARKRGHPPQAWPALAVVEDDWLRMQLLAQSLVTNYKEQARVGARNDPTGYAYWLEQRAQAFLAQQHGWLDELKLAPSAQTLPDLALLPAGSFTLSFTFTLAAPYLSKDDTSLHLLDNPVRKEWVFKLPYVAATQWKGLLRHVLWQSGHRGEDEQIRRLFGAANDDDNSGERGRLYCYPTFFDRLSLEVINPHDRQTGAGSLPIYLEAVPAGATGTFTLFYAPLDCIGADEAKTRAQVAADLTLVAQSVQSMMTRYGFGAKTSSGFGLAQAQLAAEGQLVINYPDNSIMTPPPRPVEPEQPEQLPDLRDYLAQFPHEDFTLKPDEWRRQRYSATGSQREAYKAARAAYQQYQTALKQHEQALVSYQAELEAWQAASARPSPRTTERRFHTFTELQNQADAVAAMLRQEAGEAG